MLHTIDDFILHRLERFSHWTQRTIGWSCFTLSRIMAAERVRVLPHPARIGTISAVGAGGCDCGVLRECDGGGKRGTIKLLDTRPRWIYTIPVLA